MNNFLKQFIQTSKTIFICKCIILFTCTYTSNLNAFPKSGVGNTLIGKVFFDTNLNGYLDEGETGVAGVRIGTVRGLVIETDGYGRFYIPDGNISKGSFGLNQLLKLDIQSLPKGARITSENPRVIRSTNMGLNKINFGVVF